METPPNSPPPYQTPPREDTTLNMTYSPPPPPMQDIVNEIDIGEEDDAAAVTSLPRLPVLPAAITSASHMFTHDLSLPEFLDLEHDMGSSSNTLSQSRYRSHDHAGVQHVPLSMRLRPRHENRNGSPYSQPNLQMSSALASQSSNLFQTPAREAGGRRHNAQYGPLYRTIRLVARENIIEEQGEDDHDEELFHEQQRVSSINGSMLRLPSLNDTLIYHASHLPPRNDDSSFMFTGRQFRASLQIGMGMIDQPSPSSVMNTSSSQSDLIIPTQIQSLDQQSFSNSLYSVTYSLNFDAQHEESNNVGNQIENTTLDRTRSLPVSQAFLERSRFSDESSSFFIGIVADHDEEKQDEENHSDEDQESLKTSSRETIFANSNSEASGSTCCNSSQGGENDDLDQYCVTHTPRCDDSDDIEELLKSPRPNFFYLRQVCSTGDDNNDRSWCFSETNAEKLRRVKSAPSIFRERSFSSSCCNESKSKDAHCFIGFANLSIAIRQLQKIITAWFRKWPRRSRDVSIHFQQNTS